MRKADVLVIGGSVTGHVAAMTTKSNYPDKEVILIRKEEKVMIPCGIPYIFSNVGDSDNNILPDGLNKIVVIGAGFWGFVLPESVAGIGDSVS